jgi:hypothetical protein
MPDDGDSTKGKKLGPSQRQAMRLDNLERGAYRLVLKPRSGDTDLVIKYNSEARFEAIQALQTDYE